MKRESIIRGVAHWAAKEFCPRLPEFSPQRIGIEAVDNLAQNAPAAAESLLAGFLGGSPFIGALLAAASGNQFDAVAAAITEAVRKEQKMTVSVPTPLGPRVWSLAPVDVEKIVSEIRTAEANNA